MRNVMRAAAVALLPVIASPASPAGQEVRLRPTTAVYLDSMGAGMHGPRGVDFDGSSLLVVADTDNGRLLLYTVEERKIASSAAIQLSQATDPVRVRFDPQGGILVLDGRSHRIVRTDRTGEFLGYVDVPESGRIDPVPRSFDLDPAGRIYVLEPASGRVLVLGTDGSLEREIAYAPEARSLADLAVGADGSVFVVDSVGRRVFVARAGEEVLKPLTEPLRDDMTFPTGIAADSSGDLYLADDHGGGIVILGQDGSFRGRESAMGWREGLLRYPSGLCADRHRLFVADRGNNRVQVFAIVR